MGLWFNCSFCCWILGFCLIRNDCDGYQRCCFQLKVKSSDYDHKLRRPCIASGLDFMFSLVSNLSWKFGDIHDDAANKKWCWFSCTSTMTTKKWEWINDRKCDGEQNAFQGYLLLHLFLFVVEILVFFSWRSNKWAWIHLLSLKWCLSCNGWDISRGKLNGSWIVNLSDSFPKISRENDSVELQGFSKNKHSHPFRNQITRLWLKTSWKRNISWRGWKTLIITSQEKSKLFP